jgi:SsrA-binding protein
MSQTPGIVVTGASGRMGQMLIRTISESEVCHLVGAVERKGYTIVPLELYWQRGKAKIRIGLAKGKKQHDKRETEKERDWSRDKARLLRRG